MTTYVAIVVARRIDFDLVDLGMQNMAGQMATIQDRAMEKQRIEMEVDHKQWVFAHLAERLREVQDASERLSQTNLFLDGLRNAWRQQRDCGPEFSNAFA